MKTLIATAVSLVLVSCALAMTIQEQKQMMVGIAQECKASVGASDNDLSLLILKKPMTTKEGKCLTFCIMTGVGIVDEDTRKLKKDEFVDYVKVPTKGDAKLMAKLSDIAENCLSVTDPDNCEFAFKTIACLKSGMAAAKIRTDIGI